MISSNQNGNVRKWEVTVKNKKQRKVPRISRTLFAVATFVIGLRAADLLALGIVAPNGDDSNQYYQVNDTTLYRFDCPEGVVPTAISCNENQKPLGNYARIRSSILRELDGQIAKHEASIGTEVQTLKENEPEVKAMRAAVREYATKVDQAAESILKTEQYIESSKHNLALIGEELKIIAEALKHDPTEVELKRLLKRQQRYQTLHTKFKAQFRELEKELIAKKEEKERLGQLIQTTNTKLSAYLAALHVTSQALTKMQASKAAYDRERALLPELDARVTGKGADELKIWEDEGATELFARMLKHVDICNRAEQQ